MLMLMMMLALILTPLLSPSSTLHDANNITYMYSHRTTPLHSTPYSTCFSSSFFISLHYLPCDTSPPGAGVGASTNGVYFNSLGIFGRVIRMTLAHPLLALSVKMVTLPELQTSNWFLSYLHTLAKQGVGGLYSGIRASFLFAALPMNHIWLGEEDNIPP